MASGMVVALNPAPELADPKMLTVKRQSTIHLATPEHGSMDLVSVHWTRRLYAGMNGCG